MRIVRSALVVVGIAMVLATAARVQVWSGPERGIWMPAVRHSPEKPRPLINLGRMFAIDGADDLAANAFLRAADLAADPRRLAFEGPTRALDSARLNLALIRAQQGRFTDALALTERIQPRGTPSLVTLLEAQWRVALASGSSSSAF